MKKPMNPPSAKTRLTQLLHTPLALGIAMCLGTGAAVACYVPIVRDCPPKVIYQGEECGLDRTTPNYPWVRSAPPESWGWTQLLTTDEKQCLYRCPSKGPVRLYEPLYVWGSRCRGH
jgi:hypothetical protein